MGFTKYISRVLFLPFLLVPLPRFRRFYASFLSIETSISNLNLNLNLQAFILHHFHHPSIRSTRHPPGFQRISQLTPHPSHQPPPTLHPAPHRCTSMRRILGCITSPPMRYENWPSARLLRGFGGSSVESWGGLTWGGLRCPPASSSTSSSSAPYLLHKMSADGWWIQRQGYVERSEAKPK